MSASSYTTIVEALYVAHFGRSADVAGLNAMAAQLAAADTSHTGTTITGLAAEAPNVPALNALITSFGTSAESEALYGNGTATSFVTAIYEHLFDRAPDATGLNFWVNALNADTVTKGEAALRIMSSALQNTTAQGETDTATINNKVAAASYYSSSMAADATGDDVASYVGAAAAATARGFLSTVNSSTSLSSTAFQTDASLTIQNVDLQPNLTHIYSDNLPAHTAGSTTFDFPSGATFDGMPELTDFNGAQVGDWLRFSKAPSRPILAAGLPSPPPKRQTPQPLMGTARSHWQTDSPLPSRKQQRHGKLRRSPTAATPIFLKN